MNSIFKYAFLVSLIALLACQESSTASNNQTTAPTQEPPSLETMIGQMLMVGFRGIRPEEVSEQFLQNLATGKIGGTVLFDYDVVNKEFVRNIKSPEQVQSLITYLQENAKVPLLVAVDQEGGKVNRLKAKYGFPASVSNKYLGTVNNLDTTRMYAAKNAQNLKSLGFNVNFSPAVDVDLNPKNPVIGKYERSYSSDHEVVIRNAKVWIEEHEKKGILSTLKHFPGHGSSDADSHEGFTDVTKYWQEKELIPFREILKEDQLLSVMTAHVFNSNLDADYPATLSPNVIDKYLRREWKFNGLVFSDDLQMNAVNKLFDFETIVYRSILSGVDILVYGNNLEHDDAIPEKVIQTVIGLVESGKISKERIRQSYDRIMAVKNKL